MAIKAETGQRETELVSLVVTELRGLNFEFESEESAARRMIELIRSTLDACPCDALE